MRGSQHPWLVICELLQIFKIKSSEIHLTVVKNIQVWLLNITHTPGLQEGADQRKHWSWSYWYRSDIDKGIDERMDRKTLKDKGGTRLLRAFIVILNFPSESTLTQDYGKARWGWGKAFSPGYCGLLARVWASESDRPGLECWLCHLPDRWLCKSFISSSKR